ncbi:MAG TPA: DUF4339 domain-containing protein [Chitinophagaceae bacterium]|nr:DUF4339 domain-containing protein [Chitinophagaceae bacterium]
MKIYFLQKDQQFLGPFTLDEMRAQSITKKDMIWKDGTPDWVPAIALEELACMFRGQTSLPTQNYPSGGEQPPAKPIAKWLNHLAIISRLWANGNVSKQYA